MKQLLTDDLQSRYDEIDAQVDTFLDNEAFFEARDYLKKIVDQLPPTTGKLFRAAIATLQAETFLELTHYDDAYEYAKDAVEAGWSTPLSHSTLAWAYYHGLDDCEKAKEHFLKAIELDPDDAFVYFGLANVVRYTDGLPDALSYIEKSLALDPGYIPAYSYAAELSFELCDTAAATRYLNQGRQLAPDDPELSLLQAQLLASMKKFPDALMALQCVVTDDQPPLEAILLEIELRLRREEYEEARKLSIQASNQFPTKALAFVQLAASQLFIGKTAFALKAAERAVELDSELIDAYLIRAATRLASKDYSAGLSDLQSVRFDALELPQLIYGYTYFNTDDELKRPSYQRLISELEQEALAQLNQQVVKNDTSTDLHQKPHATTEEGQNKNPFAGMPNIPGFDPSTILKQMFDSEGNVRPMFKPILKMAMKNLPSMLKTLPPEVLANQNIDPKLLEMPIGNLSDEEFDRQMKLFYQSLKHLI